MLFRRNHFSDLCPFYYLCHKCRWIVGLCLCDQSPSWIEHKGYSIQVGGDEEVPQCSFRGCPTTWDLELGSNGKSLNESKSIHWLPQTFPTGPALVAFGRAQILISGSMLMGLGFSGRQSTTHTMDLRRSVSKQFTFLYARYLGWL